MTVLDLIKNALQTINVVAINEDVAEPDANLALDVLNMMLDQWSLEKLLVYYDVNETFTLTSGTGTYTIGPIVYAGNFYTTRPIKITSAFVRDSTTATAPIDFPLEIISNTDYREIALKSQAGGYPRFLNYVPMLENIYIESSVYGGQINLWPIPNGSALTLGLSQTKQFANFSSLTTTVTLPPGYKSALVYNLAVELAPRFNFEPSMLILKNAMDTKANVKRMNGDPVRSKIDYPSSGGNSFDIYAGM